jgi:16S rRNA (uracil1498-N3)-methyltransferase
MRLYFLDNSAQLDETITLSPEQSHRFSHVLRLKVGHQFNARDSKGYRYICQIISIQKKAVTITILDKFDPLLAQPSITVWQAIPKGNKFDECIPLMVEAGASQIIPMITQHSECQPSESKIERWQRLLYESIDQSGNATVQPIETPQTIQDLLYSVNSDHLLFFCHQEPIPSPTLSTLIQTLKPHQSIILAIGPEGGFSLEEVEIFKQKGFHALYFRQTILRSEHAACFFLAGIQLLYQELKG